MPRLPKSASKYDNMEKSDIFEAILKLIRYDWYMQKLVDVGNIKINRKNVNRT